MRHCGRGNDTHVSSRISDLESFQRWEVPEELDITLSIICLHQHLSPYSILYIIIHKYLYEKLKQTLLN